MSGFHGDWALIDTDGHWFLHGRSDDTFNIAGRRIAAHEIESLLIGHPDVSEAAVIAVPDPIKGCAIIAFIVPLTDRQPELDTLKSWVETRLGKAFLPSLIFRVSRLPKTRSAKIVRRLIRAKYLGEALGDLSALENPGALDEIVPETSL